MNGKLDISRCMTMASCSAFLVLRQYLDSNPVSNIESAVKTIRQTSFDTAGLDYDGGAEIHRAVRIDLPKTGRGALRTLVCELIKISPPWWLRLVPYGRDRVRSVLEPDQLQCLREAGLFDAVPDNDVLAWWDEIGSLIRGAVETEKMLRAREAERLSFEYERSRLKALGINVEPEWVSLEDNTLGYDIRSYDLRGDEIVHRLIEVKSTTTGAIFISRNEWFNAATAEEHFCFHVWERSEKRISEYAVSAIEPHIPADRGAGEWQDVRIDLVSSPGIDGNGTLTY